MKAVSYSTLLILMFTIIMDIMGVGLVLPLLPNLVVIPSSPFYCGQNHFICYGIVLAIFSVGVFLGSPFLGAFSDKIGRKKVLLLSLASNTLIYFVSAFSITHSLFLLFILMRFNSGFFSGSFDIAQAAIADKSSKEEKVKNMSYMILAVALGVIVGPFLGSVTVSFGIIVPFLLASLLSLINVVCLYIFFKETHERKAHKISIINLFKACVFPFQDLRIRKLAMVFLLFQFAWGFYFQSIPLVLEEEYKFSPERLSVFFVVLGIGFAIVPLFLLDFMKRYFSLKTITFLGLIVSGLFISFSLLFKAFEEMQWIVIFIFAVFEALAFSSLLAMLSNKVGSEEQGKMMGGCGTLYAISFIVIGLSIGVLSSISVWFLVIISAVFFFLTSVFLPIAEKKSI